MFRPAVAPRRLLSSAACVLACALPHVAPAQTAAARAVPAAGAPDSGVERRIERIRIDERALSAEELRHGGETQSIVVTPRELPAYEIQPTDGARSRQFARDGLSEAKGARVWNLLRF